MEATTQIKYVLTHVFSFKISHIWSLVVPAVCLSLQGTSAAQTEIRPTQDVWAWYCDEDLVYNLAEDLAPLHLLCKKVKEVSYNLY